VRGFKGVSQHPGCRSDFISETISAQFRPSRKVLAANNGSISLANLLGWPG